MRCCSYQDLISRYIDDAVSQHERAALFEHLGHCPACAALLARYRAIEVSFRKIPEGQPSPSLRQTVMSSVVERNWRGKNRLGFRVPSSLLAGAALALIVVVSVGVLAASHSSLIPLEEGSGTATGGDFVADTIGTNDKTREISENMSIAEAPVLAVGMRNPSVAATLERAFMQTGVDHPVRIPLPRYLPVGMHLEQFNLNAGRPSNDLEIAYRAQDGKLVDIRHVLGSATPPISREAKRVIVRGREWWIDQHPEVAPLSLPAYIVFTRQNDDIIVLDAVLPLDELIRMVESIEWTEDE